MVGHMLYMERVTDLICVFIQLKGCVLHSRSRKLGLFLATWWSFISHRGNTELDGPIVWLNMATTHVFIYFITFVSCLSFVMELKAAYNGIPAVCHLNSEHGLGRPDERSIWMMQSCWILVPTTERGHAGQGAALWSLAAGLWRCWAVALLPTHLSVDRGARASANLKLLHPLHGEDAAIWGDLVVICGESCASSTSWPQPDCIIRAGGSYYGAPPLCWSSRETAELGLAGNGLLRA